MSKIFKIFLDTCLLEGISALPRLNSSESSWVLTVEAYLFCVKVDDTESLQIDLPEFSISKQATVSILQGNQTVFTEIEIPKDSVKLWWPSGHSESLGGSKLYNVSVTLGSSGDSKEIKVGFRTVELVQEKLMYNGNPVDGRSFYFRINGMPIFLKVKHI